MSGGNTCIAEPNLEDNSVKDQFSFFFFWLKVLKNNVWSDDTL